MDLLVERPGALDVHKASVTACVRVRREGQRVQEVREFKTTVRGLLALHDWLAELGVTHVAMEATGVYWKPVWAILEDEFQLLLCNAAHVKNVPGRKTDVGDSQWLCRLLECGLLRASFVPPKPVRELRELTRRRKTLVRDRQREAGRLHKALEDTGIKLDCVATDILGVSGRLMLEGLIGGERDPAALADLAKGRLRVKHSALVEAFEGVRFGDQHALLIGGILPHIDFLDAEIAALGTAIETHIAAQSQPARDGDQTGADAGTVRPFELAVGLMCSLPGIQQRTAQTLIGEFGIDMSRFPTDKHFVSWGAQCPGNHESAGKRRSGRTRKGCKWLGIALEEAALAATRSKGSYLQAQYQRLRPRIGHGRALGAVKHSILVAYWHMFTTGEVYNDLGGDYYQRRDPQRQIRRLVQQLEHLGQHVTLEAAAA